MAKTLPTKKALIYGVGEISSYLKDIRRNVRHFKRVKKAVGHGIGVKTGGVPVLQRMKQAFPFGSYGVGRPGKIRMDQLKKTRKQVGMAVVATTKKPVDKIDKIVNARGKGVRFIRRNGRIIPIRNK